MWSRTHSKGVPCGFGAVAELKNQPALAGATAQAANNATKREALVQERGIVLCELSSHSNDE